MNKKTLLIEGLAVVLTAVVAQAYNLERTMGGIGIWWDLTHNDQQVSAGKVVYRLNATCSTDFPLASTCLDTLRASFANWGAVADSKIDFAEGLAGPAPAAANDGVNNVFFVNGDPELTGGVLALTTTFFNPSTGEILDSDIRFNDSGFNFYPLASTDFLESIATHEVGHLLGLDHSFLGFVGTTLDTTLVATMFPLAVDNSMRTLEWDDQAGASSLYPEATFSANYGLVTGNVDSNAGFVLGAQITILDPATGHPILAAATGKLGNYSMKGAPAGSYAVLCEEPMNPAYLGPYYALSPTGYSPWLYLNHELTSFTQALPGDPTFDASERVVVVAGLTTPNIDFNLTDVTPLLTVPPTIPIPTDAIADSASVKISSSVNGGGGGCGIAPDGGTSTALIVLMTAPVFWFARRRRKV